MKELSIQEKAKRYDDAIEKAKDYYHLGDDNHKMAIDAKAVMEYIFPELKESEDEKMIQYFKDLAPFDNAYELYEKYGFSHKDAIAWLEKQGGHAKFINGIQVGDKVTRNEDGVLVNLSQLNRVAKKDEKQGKQKPAVSQFTSEQARVLDEHIDKFLEKKSVWSEKYIADVFEKVGLAKIAREQGNENLSSVLQSALIELGKFMPQQKQEWSEEDEYYLNSCITKIEIDIQNWEGHGKTMIDVDKEIISWLKSLKGRVGCEVNCTTTKKWSEEDIATISRVISIVKWAAYSDHSHPILNDEGATELVERLKSLKERYTWKPSDEQMEALDDFIYAKYPNVEKHGAAVKSLYQDLNKL